MDFRAKTADPASGQTSPEGPVVDFPVTESTALLSRPSRAAHPARQRHLPPAAHRVGQADPHQVAARRDFGLKIKALAGARKGPQGPRSALAS